MTRFRAAIRSAAMLALLAAGTAVSACALIDEDAELNPDVMRDPDGFDSNYPRGHASQNPVF